MTTLAQFLTTHALLGWMTALCASAAVTLLLWRRQQAFKARQQAAREAEELERLLAMPATWAEGVPPESVIRRLEPTVADAAEAIAALAARLADAAATHGGETGGIEEQPRHPRKPTIH